MLSGIGEFYDEFGAPPSSQGLHRNDTNFRDVITKKHRLKLRCARFLVLLGEKLDFKLDRIRIVFGFADVVLARATTQRTLDRELLVDWEQHVHSSGLKVWLEQTLINCGHYNFFLYK
jgi:hypothetical protein